MCLTGILGAEAGGLPSEVVEEIETFFRRCIDHLRWFCGPDFVARAFHVMAARRAGSSSHEPMATSARSTMRPRARRSRRLHLRPSPWVLEIGQGTGEVVGKRQLVSWMR